MDSGRIYGVGETVYDIIFRDGKIEGGCPGGSVLNSMVTLGRLGLPAVFLSEYGSDQIGSLINGFLQENSIDISRIRRPADSKTPLALAFQHGNKTKYDFYRCEPQVNSSFEIPEFSGNDILLFGSFYSILPGKRDTVVKILESARRGGALIVYDPNFRNAHLDELPELLPAIRENIGYADIIRGSDEDFRNIFGAETFEEATESIRGKSFIYTMGECGVSLQSGGLTKNYSAKAVNPVSTIGAGDSFNAAVCYCLHRLGISSQELSNIDESLWDTIINTGIDFSAEVCQSRENYIAQSFAEEFGKNFNNKYRRLRS